MKESAKRVKRQRLLVQELDAKRTAARAHSRRPPASFLLAVCVWLLVSLSGADTVAATPTL